MLASLACFPAGGALAADANPQNEAAALSVVAAAKAKAGRYRLCADLYRQAYRLDPSFLGYLYSAARCAQKAGALDEAERGYRAFLGRAPHGHPLLSRGRAHLQEVLERRRAELAAEPGRAEPGRAEPGKAQRTPAGSAEHRPVGGRSANTGSDSHPVGPPPRASKVGAWAATGGAALMLVTATTLSLWARSRATVLDDRLKPPPGNLLIRSMTRDRALVEAERIDRIGYAGFALLGAGVAAAGVATWLWLFPDEERSSALRWTPTVGGWQVIARW